MLSTLTTLPPSVDSDVNIENDNDYKHQAKALNLIFFYNFSPHTDRQTDRQTFVPIEAPTRSLKI